MQQLSPRFFATIAASLLGFVAVAADEGSLVLHASGQIVGIVEQGTNRLGGAVVNLTDVPGTFGPPSGTVLMDQINKEFVPNVLPIVKGTAVTFRNSDPYFHNVFSSSRVKTFNVSQQKKGDTSDLVFDKLGIVPIRCHVHPMMKAFIVVLPNPFFAMTNSKGQFKISNVPAGTYSIKVWSPLGGSQMQSVVVPSGGEAKIIFHVSP